MNATLVWFRHDLRLADNPAFTAAVNRGGPVVPVFLWSPEEEGAWPPGAASRWWLHHSLAALDASLREHGSRLIYRRGPALPVLRALLDEVGADKVYWNRRYEPAAQVVEAGVKELPGRSFNASLLVEPWELKPYRVFTPFWRACVAKNIDEPRSVVTRSNRRTRRSASLPSLKLEDLGLLPTLDWADKFHQVWQPGEAGARQLLQRFDAGRYRQRRDLPAVAGTSRLSPHLHFGEISPWRVWQTGSVEFQRQLGWREFAYHLLWHFPDTAEQPLRPEFARFPWRRDPAGWRAWQRGRTGFPLVDAGLRELWATGWMHNRVRMIAASFLVKDLLLPWREGARWFWETLVDANLANNTLGWQWTAGCGADAAPFFRVFNPALQAEKFDPTGAYVRRWVREESPPVVDHAAARIRALQAFQSLKRPAGRVSESAGRVPGKSKRPSRRS